MRTLLQAGNVNIIAEEAERYKIEVVDGLQTLKKICK